MKMILFNGSVRPGPEGTDVLGVSQDGVGFNGGQVNGVVGLKITYGNIDVLFIDNDAYNAAFNQLGWANGFFHNSLRVPKPTNEGERIAVNPQGSEATFFFGDIRFIPEINDERTQEPAHRDVSVTSGAAPDGNEPGSEGAGSGGAPGGADTRPAADAERPAVPEVCGSAEQTHQGVLNPAFKYADEIDLACFLEGAHKVLRENRYNEYPGGGYMDFTRDCLRYFKHLDVEPPEDGYTGCFAYDVSERFGEEIASLLYQDGNVSDYDAANIAERLIAEITPDEVAAMVVPDDPGVYTLKLNDERAVAANVADFWLFDSRSEYEKACRYLQREGVKHIRNDKDFVTDAYELASCLVEAGITKSEQV